MTDNRRSISLNIIEGHFMKKKSKMIVFLPSPPKDMRGYCNSLNLYVCPLVYAQTDLCSRVPSLVHLSSWGMHSRVSLSIVKMILKAFGLRARRPIRFSPLTVRQKQDRRRWWDLDDSTLVWWESVPVLITIHLPAAQYSLWLRSARSSAIETLPWSTLNPGLTPFDDIWGILGCRMREDNISSCTDCSIIEPVISRGPQRYQHLRFQRL